VTQMAGKGLSANENGRERIGSVSLLDCWHHDRDYSVI